MKLSKKDLNKLILEEMNSVIKTMTEVGELSDEEIDAEFAGAPTTATQTTAGTPEADATATPEGEEALKMKANAVRQQFMELVPELVPGSISEEERHFIFKVLNRLVVAAQGGDMKPLIPRLNKSIGITGVDRLAKKT